MSVDLNEGIPLGRTHEEQRQDELLKAMQAIALQCFNTCEAVKNFSNMVYDMLDAQGIVAEINAKRLKDAQLAQAKAAEAGKKPKKKVKK